MLAAGPIYMPIISGSTGKRGGKQQQRKCPEQPSGGQSPGGSQNASVTSFQEFGKNKKDMPRLLEKTAACLLYYTIRQKEVMRISVLGRISAFLAESMNFEAVPADHKAC
ncbi:hypothetical protein D3C80_1765080 [compost metagenome]